MPIERSHGAARPTLPRASDLPTIEAAREPRQGRTEGGHFAAGNAIGVGARWKHSIKRLLGSKASDTETSTVAGDATRVYLAVLKVMPSDAAPVRSLVALHARHVAIAAFFTDRASAAGLETDAGINLLKVASDHGQRAERTVVTALDVATRLARSKSDDSPSPWFQRAPVANEGEPTK